MTISVSLSSPAIPAEGCRLVALTGTEGISDLYRFDVGLVIVDQDFDADSALRNAATIVFDTGAEQHRYHGILAAVELIDQEGAQATYRATLVPRLWNLTHMHHSRVYTDNTILEIIEAVLTASGLTTDDFEITTVGQYETVEHLCQYKESNYQFISRWMEKVGLYFFFDHEGDSEKLIITDSIGLHAGLDRGDVRYVPAAAGDVTSRICFDTFMARHSALPATTKLKDYDYLHPTLALDGAHDIGAGGLGEISMFGENTTTSAAVAHLAQVRAEEYASMRKVFLARGYVAGIRPNHRFTVEEHPNQNYNGMQYLCVATRHTANQGTTDRLKRLMGMDLDWEEQYSAEVTAIFADVQFRSRRRAAWPRVDGYEFAVVDGEADSEYAQIDEHGRYKCRIMFDESDLVDGSATTWVRMMQPHAGGIEGFHFPLRKGTEVLLFFLGGDPDRPVIAGAAPNSLTPSPVTSGNHTRNVIQTGGRNRLELEDESGKQRITMSTPYSNSYLRIGSPNAGHEVILRTDDSGLLELGDSYDMRVGVAGAVDHEGGPGSYHGIIHNNMITQVVTGDVTRDVEAGSWYETVAQDIDVYSQGGDIMLTTDTGEIFAHGKTDIRAHADGSKVEIKATAGRIHLEGQTDVKVKANTGKVEVTAPQDVKIKSLAANVDIRAPAGKVNVDGVEVKTNATGPWYNYTYGPCNWFEFSTKAKITVSGELQLNVGIKSETKVGVFNENLIGGKMGVSIGLLVEATAAARFGCHMTSEVDISPMKVGKGGMWMVNRITSIHNFAGPKLTRAAAFILG